VTVQILGAAVPSLFGFVAYTAGARASVFGGFVALSVVIFAAVYPRESGWDDAVDRLAVGTDGRGLDREPG
jgi:hypothetical protein